MDNRYFKKRKKKKNSVILYVKVSQTIILEYN